MTVEPYVHFEGRCDEAIEFYKDAIGAKVEMLVRFKDCPDPKAMSSLPPGGEQKVMHATLRVGDSNIFVSDGHSSGKAVFNGFSLSITVATAAEADRLFNPLAAGGSVTMPLTKTFFSPRFGMLVDRFGVSWMILVRQ